MALFFTADTHFGDHRTINIHRRPFTDVASMDETIVNGWNEVVRPEDEVWHLGDVARRSGNVAALLAQLNGIKHLVRGNNDGPGNGDAAGWASVQDYAELTQDGVLLVLCHYPFRSWNGQHRRSINLHGHSHGKLKPMLRQFDVGVDAQGFRPMTLATLLGAVSTDLPDDVRTARTRPSATLGQQDAVTVDAHPVTPDGRYFVVRGRLWRRANPALPEQQRTARVNDLMAARRAVGAALRTGDQARLAAARAQVDHAKVALGERGPVCWQDGLPDLNRRMAKNTDYAEWFDGQVDTGRVLDLTSS